MKPTLDPNLDDDDLAADLVREVAEMLDNDPKAVARGVQVVRVHVVQWERMDCPNAIRWRGKVVPIEPTGRRWNRVTWRYCKVVRGPGR